MNSALCRAHCVTLCITLKTSKQKRLFLNPLSSSIQFTTQLHKQLQQHKAGSSDTVSAPELPRDPAGCSRQETRAGACASHSTNTSVGRTNLQHHRASPVNPAGRLPVHKPLSLWELPFHGKMSHSHPQVRISCSLDLDSWLTIDLVNSLSRLTLLSVLKMKQLLNFRSNLQRRTKLSPN